MKAEGISIAQGYVKPIYLEPMYQKKIVYGRKGWPFNCTDYEGKINYERGNCPKAEEMHFLNLLTTDICKYPNSEIEIDEFVSAIDKILDNKDMLTTYK